MTYLTEHTDGGVHTITMTQGHKLNALSDGMLAALQGAFDTIATTPDIKVVILRAEGKAFCAGHDLKEMQAMRDAEDKGAAAFKDLFDRCATLMLSIRALPQPVIAQVHGIATAAGCQLVATCDMAIAADSTRFGVNGINIGLFCATPMVALTRAIGPKSAFEMLTTGKFIPAAQAATLGLISRAVPEEQLEQETQELAATLAGKLGTALRIGKRAFYAQAEMTEAEAYAFAGDVMVTNMLDADTDEGLTAFLEKRAPHWAP